MVRTSSVKGLQDFSTARVIGTVLLVDLNERQHPLNFTKHLKFQQTSFIAFQICTLAPKIMKIVPLIIGTSSYPKASPTLPLYFGLLVFGCFWHHRPKSFCIPYVCVALRNARFAQGWNPDNQWGRSGAAATGACSKWSCNTKVARECASGLGQVMFGDSL